MSAAPTRPELVGLHVGDRPSQWEALGFSTMNSCVWLGPIRIELGALARGIVGWRLGGIPPTAAIDGLPTEVDASPAGGPARSHPNGAVGLDHLVVITPDFDRSSAALARAGMPLRRIREAPAGFRQGFRRLGPAILELVEASGAHRKDEPARFWGLVVIVSDLAALAERLEDRLGAIREAVQPGRQIATLRESAGLGQAVAFMTEEV